MTLRQTLGRALVGDELAAMREALRERGDNLLFLTERLAELESRLETEGWMSLSSFSEREFSRQALRDINKLARLYWLKNPLVKRAVETQAHYVFAQGMNVQARHPRVNEVVQAFMDDPKNQSELTSHQARLIKETELQCFGNLFFVFFVDGSTGHVRVRTIPCDEIEDIICNPEDAKDPWYYRRTWTETIIGADGAIGAPISKTAYYPDWRYEPAAGQRLASIGGHKVEWDNPVYHVKVNCLSDMRFGVSEVYAAFDWAKAYTEFLSNWASIVRAYSVFAWKQKVPGGAAGVAAAKAKLGTTLTGSISETNPPPVTGSVFIGAEGVDLEPIRTAGATTKAEDGRYLRLMVSSATGIFEHYLTGDPSTGNLATARAMERPMEFMFLSRRTLWADVFTDILQFVIKCSARAANGKLRGQVIKGLHGEDVIVLEDDPETGKPIDLHVDVTFPPLLESDITATVGAITTAATLDGKPLAGTVDLETLSRMLLTALGLPDVDEVMAKMFPPEGEEGEPPLESEASKEVALLDALRELRAAVRGLVEANRGE